MATVPTLDNSEVQLQPTPLDPKAAATLGGEIVDLGQGISALGTHLGKMRDAVQQTQQLTGLTDDFNKIHNQASTDKSVWDAPQRYSEALDKAVLDRANNISDPVARDRYLQQATRMADTRSVSINNMLLQKQVAEAKYTLTNAGKSFVLNYANSGSDDERSIQKSDFNSTIDRFKSLGIVGDAQAEAYRQHWSYLGEVATAKQDATKLNPQRTLEELDKMESGKDSIYPKFKEQDTREIRTLAERQIKFNTSQQKKNMANIQERNARDIDLMFKTNAPNLLQHVEEKYYTGQINQKTFDTYSKAASTPIMNPEGKMVLSGKVTSDGTDPASYIESLAYISDPHTTIDDARNFIMEKFNTLKISRADRDKLYDLSIRPMGKDYQSIKDVIGAQQANADANDKFKRSINGSLNWIYQNVPGLKNLVPEDRFHSAMGQKEYAKIDDAKAVRMAKDFVKRISADGVEPKDYPRIANDVINEERLIGRPEIAGYGEDGQLEQDDMGNQATVSNNGAVKEEDDGFKDNY